ncbi:hypothetical protein K431DRAFT_311416 [Polychaeton citri CBS 116435]|uniref:DUF7770 domain-containing protein n=1 Tax=Polychaeton citri CBS 116435 TaxID=1314669 RepID=A0A9P4QD56_9PEZI|nr:hypothetical protein K431DRAFT_311416 [Polychaeton citri CBS 116435]
MAPTATYAVDRVPDNERSQRVVLVRVTIHSLGAIVPGGQLSQNHWTIELLLSDGCIRLDMSLYEFKSATDFRGLLRVIKLAYQLSQHHVMYFDFEVVGAKSVGHFMNNIITNARHRYNMTSNGVGCRHWICTVIRDWQQADLIMRKTSQGHDIEDYISYNWSHGQAPVPLEIKYGTFY